MQIVMGTFIVAFIGNGFVASTQKSSALKWLDSKPMLRRRVLVLLYFSAIVSVVVFFGVMTIPDIVREGTDFVRRLKSENAWVVVLERLLFHLGCMSLKMDSVAWTLPCLCLEQGRCC